MNLTRLSLFAVVLAGCASPPSQPQCGLETLCGEGTTMVGAECRGTNKTACGDGTRAFGDFCVPAETACGPGTILKGAQCQVPVPDPNVLAFVSRTSYTEAGDGKAYSYPGGLEHNLRYVWTELPATDARAWGTGEAPMIGTGLAMHLVMDGVFLSTSATTFAQELTNLTDSTGRCLADVTPRTVKDRYQLAVYQWVSGTATPIACAKAGSVTVGYSSYYDRYTVEVNAVLGDGTVVRKTFTQNVTN